MDVPFTKMSGAGNDFVVVDRRGDVDRIDWKRYAPVLCNRRRGIGADGLIVIRSSPENDFTMVYYNADGSTGSLCGNGGRCAAGYVLKSKGRDKTTFDSCGRPYNASATENGIIVSMDNPGRPEMDMKLDIPGVEIPGHFVNTGSPHLVLLTDSPEFEKTDILESGRKIRNAARFAPAGTNVDYVKVTGEGRIAVRTYERGVEDETWACGTGAVASAVIYVMKYGGEGQQSVRVTPKSGETLLVCFRRQGRVITDVSLEGPAVVTFSGTFETDITGA